MFSMELHMGTNTAEPVAEVTTEIEFLDAHERLVGDTGYDMMDYCFRLRRGDDYLEVAIGIPGDWEDRLSAAERLVIAETWLKHRLHHGYNPFRGPHCEYRLLDVPFSVVEHWHRYRALPH